MEHPTISNLKKLMNYIDILKKYVPKSKRTLLRSHECIGRNAPCHCGSKKKFKHCCWAKEYQPGGDLFSSIYEVENQKNYVWLKKHHDRIKNERGALQENKV